MWDAGFSLNNKQICEKVSMYATKSNKTFILSELYKGEFNWTQLFIYYFSYENI